MIETKEFAVIELKELIWPSELHLPSKRFRLFVAADTQKLSVGAISDFAEAALRNGMVYLCTWGVGCERLHDIVDEVLVEDDLGPGMFRGPSSSDTIMTTWHARDSLEEALDFLATCAYPSDGFVEGSDYRLVLSVGHADWASRAREFLSAATFFV